MPTRDEIKGDASTLVIPDVNAASLAVPSTVEALVREYVAKMITLHGDWGDGTITGAEMTKQATDESARMQDIFFGKDKTYEATDWNTPEKLGVYLQNGDPAIDPAGAVASVFNKGTLDIWEGLNMEIEGKFAAGMIETVIDEVIARLMSYMLGVPDDTFVKQE